MVHSNLLFNMIWHTQSVAANVLCWRLTKGDVNAGHQSYVWIGDIITGLLKFPCQQHWLFYQNKWET